MLFPKKDEQAAYDELVRSIPKEERQSVIAELTTQQIIERSTLLQSQLAANQTVAIALSESRVLFLAALKGLQETRLSVAQLATLHLVDSAIRTLCTNPAMYLIYQFINDQQEIEVTRNLCFCTLASLRGIPTALKKHRYNEPPPLPQERTLDDLPIHMQQPLMQRFFYFSDSEWAFFCEQMNQAAQSEQYFYVLLAPTAGCWSGIIHTIQGTLKCMQVLDRLAQTKEGGLLKENIMLVPSFSMFQAALDAKANTLGRTSVELIPTYGLINPERYATLKATGKIAMCMYLPEQIAAEQYQDKKGRFRATIDGYPFETAFAGAIHDVYHAMRELSMSEQVAKARMRLASIAKGHPNNQLNEKSRAVDDILVDGELIFSYPPTADTLFNIRPPTAQAFGELFYCSSLIGSLHADLKYAFLVDMVLNETLWRQEFGLGQSDLREADQAIYEEIKSGKAFLTSLRSVGDAFFDPPP